MTSSNFFKTIKSQNVHYWKWEEVKNTHSLKIKKLELSIVGI